MKPSETANLVHDSEPRKREAFRRMVLVDHLDFLADVVDVFWQRRTNQRRRDKRSFIELDQRIDVRNLVLEAGMKRHVVAIESEDLATPAEIANYLENILAHFVAALRPGSHAESEPPIAAAGRDLLGAMIAVVAIFGISHAYQGWKGAVKATIAGAVMAAIVLATGSLIPAMIVHALIDAGGGTVGNGARVRQQPRGRRAASAWFNPARGWCNARSRHPSGSGIAAPDGARGHPAPLGGAG